MLLHLFKCGHQVTGFGDNQSLRLLLEERHKRIATVRSGSRIDAVIVCLLIVFAQSVRIATERSDSRELIIREIRINEVCVVIIGVKNRFAVGGPFRIPATHARGNTLPPIGIDTNTINDDFEEIIEAMFAAESVRCGNLDTPSTRESNFPVVRRPAKTAEGVVGVTGQLLAGSIHVHDINIPITNICYLPGRRRDFTGDISGHRLYTGQLGMGRD